MKVPDQKPDLFRRGKMWGDIMVIDEWLDSKVGRMYDGQPLAQDWARVAKITEEAGEAIDALIRFTGQNPRKGTCGTLDELLGELADTAFTAILAMQHFTKDTCITEQVLAEVLERIVARVPRAD